MAIKTTDPVETFLRFLGQSEEALNALALKVTASERFTKGAHTVTALNRTLLQRAERQRARVLRDLSLMSQAQFEQLNDRVTRLESAVELIREQAGVAPHKRTTQPQVKRPARTRKPPSDASLPKGRA